MYQQALTLASLPPNAVYTIIISLVCTGIILQKFRTNRAVIWFVAAYLLLCLAYSVIGILHSLPLESLEPLVALACVALVMHTLEVLYSKLRWISFSISVLVIAIVILGIPTKYITILTGLMFMLALWNLVLGYRSVRRFQPRNKMYYWLPTLAILAVLVFSSYKDQLLFGWLLPLPALMMVSIVYSSRLPDVKFILRDMVRAIVLIGYTAVLLGFGFLFISRFILPQWHLVLYGVLLILVVFTFNIVGDLCDWLLDKLLRQQRGLAVDLINELDAELRKGFGLPFIEHTLSDFLVKKVSVSQFSLVFADSSSNEQDDGYLELDIYQQKGDGNASLVLLQNEALVHWLRGKTSMFYHADLEQSREYQEVNELIKKWFNDLQAEIFIPLFDQGHWSGFLVIGPRSRGNYEIEDHTLFTAIGTQAAAMIVNARLVDQLTNANNDLSRSLTKLDTLSNDLSNFETIKSNFINIASHELRTPLTVTRGYVEMLLEDQDLPQTQRDLLNGIYKGVLKQEEILDSLFELARLDSTNANLRSEDLSLNEIAKEVSQKMSKQVSQRQQVLILDLPELPPIAGDRPSIRRLFLNILQNAVKYTPDHGKITMTGFVVDANNTGESGVEMIIRDSGVGINKELQELIFTRFYQPGEKVDNLSSSKFRFKGSGLGLGLALSRAIVKAHGGKIWAVSAGYDEVGLPGTEFHIFFPFERQNVL